MEHDNIIEFKVSGDYALFSDPITRVGGEKYSYQIPTYEAIKGILSSVYWKPTFIWIVDQVRVINPIQTETKGIRTVKYYDAKTDLSYYTYLKDCSYQVRAHFEWNLNRPELENDRNENKHYFIAKKMVERGGRRDVFLGTRECQAYVKPCVFGSGVGFYDSVPETAFGYMYHGITYPDEAYSEKTRNHLSVRYFYPVMKNGVITFPRPEDCPVTNVIRKAEAKVFCASHKNFKNEDKEEIMNATV